MIVNGQALNNTALSEHFNADCINAISCTLPTRVSSYRVQCDIPDTTFLHSTEFSKVQHIFESLKNWKSVGVDTIQIRPVKQALDCICYYLVHIFNLALQTGCFPANMKRAKAKV